MSDSVRVQGNESLLKGAFNAIQDGIVCMDTNLVVLDHNSTMEKWIGRRFVGENCYRVIWGNEEPCKDCQAIRAIKEKTLQSRLIEPAFSDEQKQYFLAYSYPMLDDSGEVLGAVEYVRDVTERVQTEMELAKSEANWRALTESSPDFIMLLDTEGTILYTNRPMPGLTTEKILGASVFDFMLPEEKAEARACFKRIMQTGQPDEYEAVHTMKNGETRHYVSCAAGVRRDGELVGLIVASRDNTDRKRAQESLRESEQRFRSLISELPGGVFVHDIQGRLLLVNESASASTGWSCSELLNMSVADIDPESTNRMDRERFWYLLRTGESVTFQSTHVRKDGSQYPAEVHLTGIPLSGQPVILAIAYDITKRKQAEEALRQRETKLAHMNRVHTVGEMVGTLAHELNQPLYAINNYVKGVQRRLIESSLPENLKYLSNAMEQVSKEVNRAAGIISHLREFVRGRKLQRSSVNIHQLLLQAVDLLQPVARDKNTILEYEISKNLPVIQADPIQVEQVLVNLITNAIEAMVGLSINRRRVVVECGLNEFGFVEVGVSDSGNGIPDELKDKLFNAFVSTKEDGLGVGLAISRSIIDSHGGKIWQVENEPHGSRFYFTLPVAVPLVEPG